MMQRMGRAKELSRTFKHLSNYSFVCFQHIYWVEREDMDLSTESPLSEIPYRVQVVLVS